MAKSEGFQIACAVSVEKILEPLVEQISALIDRNDSLDRPKGLSQNKATILDLVKNAIGDLMKNAEEVRGECPDVSANFQVALSEIQDIGDHFHKSVNAFLDNPESEEFHAEMLRALRSLLSSVTRVFILADLIDVSQLHSCLENIKGDAECIGILTDESELSRLCSLLEDHFKDLQVLLKFRSQDFLGSKQRVDLNNSYATLTLACEMIVASTKASFCYPKLATLAANREFAVKLVNRAVDRLVCACDTTYSPATLPPLQGQAVAQLMQAVVKCAEAGVEKVESWNSTFFQSNVQKLSTEIAILTQSAGLGNIFQAGIARNIHELNEAVDLFIEAWDYETSAGLREYMMTMKRSCANIRSLISQAALTLSSSTFITNNTALSHLEESAKYASEENLVSAVAEIQQQTSDLIDSALCLCGVGTDPNMMRFVRVTANDLEQLAPQLINASKALTLRSQSSLTKENFSIFLKCYKSLVQKLCDYIDEMTNVLDFLEAYDRLLQDDINSCQTNAEAAQRSGLISVSRKLSARCYRAVRYILTKLETSNGHNANANQTQATLESIEKNLIPQLTEATREVCRNLHSRNRALQVDNVRRIGEAIRDAFSGLRPLLNTMDSRQGETSSNLAETTFDLPPPTPSLPPPLPPPQPNEYTHDSFIPDPFSGSSIRSSRSSQASCSLQQFLNRTAPNLNQMVNKFNMEQASLMYQIERMEASGNDLMVPTVRKICLRLTDVIDHMTVPEGSIIATDAELVQATHEVALMTAQLNGKCEKITRGSSEISAKRRLFTSLKNINLFSHELAVMSRVKAGLKTPNSELCLDNVIFLVRSARNLMQEVNKAMSQVRTITDQNRFRSATALPPVPPRPRRRRASTQNGSGDDCSNNEIAPFTFDVKIDRSIDFSY